MLNQPKHLLILCLVLALLLVGCQADATTEAPQESANVEPTTALAESTATLPAGLRPPNTETPSPVVTPSTSTARSTGDTPTPTETPPPTLTSTPSAPTATPYEIYWTVHPYQTSTGEVGYMVDQPEVLELAKQHFWEVYEYFSWQDGLPSLEQLEEDLKRLAVPGDEDSGTQVRLADVKKTYEDGSYLRYTLPTEYTWRDDLIGFSPSGHLVLLIVEIPDGAQMGERVDVETGEVLESEIWPGALEKMTLQWDKNLGRWLWVASAFDILEQ